MAMDRGKGEWSIKAKFNKEIKVNDKLDKEFPLDLELLIYLDEEW